MERNERITSTESQVTGACVDIINQNRNNILVSSITSANNDYLAAVNEMQTGRKLVHELIASNRGGNTGAHGFIGEITQVHVSNAKALSVGKAAEYILLDDDGPVDYLRGNTPIQQKAYNSKGFFSLKPSLGHANKYPFFVTTGGIYQIPKDQFEEYTRLLYMPKEQAGKLLKHDFRMWKKVQEFHAENSDLVIEPMVVSYDEIQVGTIDNTLDRISEDLKSTRDNRIEEAIINGKPSVSECAKVTAFSALLEGSAAGMQCIWNKTSDGQRIAEFDAEDWKEVGIESAKGTGKGGLRGAATYTLTNCAGIPGPFAAAAVTTSFETAEDIHAYKSGEMDAEELITNISEHVLDGSVSAVCTWAGMAACAKYLPANTLGGKALQLGWGLAFNYVGMKLYQSVKSKLKGKEN